MGLATLACAPEGVHGHIRARAQPLRQRHQRPHAAGAADAVLVRRVIERQVGQRREAELQARSGWHRRAGRARQQSRLHRAALEC